jgi:hypothetical protein
MRIKNNKVMIAGMFFALIGMTLPLAVFADDAMDSVAPGKPERVESGTVNIEAESMKLILGGAKGTGVLHYQGQDYPFKLSGVSVGGAGYTKVVASGTVYDLNSLEDFPGTYSGMGVGAVVVKGAGGSSWQNSKGVSISMHAETAEGLALNMGINSVTVEFTK